MYPVLNLYPQASALENIPLNKIRAGTVRKCNCLPSVSGATIVQQVMDFNNLSASCTISTAGTAYPYLHNQINLPLTS